MRTMFWNCSSGMKGPNMWLCAMGRLRTYAFWAAAVILTVSRSLRPVVPARGWDLHGQSQMQSDPREV